MEATLETVIAWLDAHESVISAIVGLGVLVGGVIGWISSVRSKRKLKSEQAVMSLVTDSAAEPNNQVEARSPAASSTLVNGATIALLPVKNDGEADSIRFSDELFDDLNSSLTRSTFLDLITVSEATRSLPDLAKQGAAYVIETSLRMRGQNARVTAQLIETQSGLHLWSDTLKRSLEDYDTDGDVLAQAIATRVMVPIFESEVSRTLDEDPNDLDTATLTRLGYAAFLFRGHDYHSFSETRELMDTAVKLDPRNARARAVRAVVIATAVAFRYSKNRAEDYEIARKDAETALRLAPSDAMTLYSNGWVVAYEHGYAKALPFLSRASAADPFNAHIQADYAYMLLRTGDLEKAEAQLTTAFELSPNDPRQYIWHFFAGMVAVHKGDVKTASGNFETSIGLAHYSPAWAMKIVCDAVLEGSDCAERSLKEFADRYNHLKMKDFIDIVNELVPEGDMLETALTLSEAWPAR